MTEDDQDVIELEGQIRRDDYMRWVAWYVYRLPVALRRTTLFFVCFSVIAIVAVPRHDTIGLLIALGCALVAAVLVWLLLGSIIRARMLKRYTTNKAMQGPIRYRFSGSGVSTESTVSQGKVDWSAYHRALETKHDFLLFFAQDVGHPMPKRFFQSEEQMERFRELLRAHLPPEVCKV